MQLLLYIASTGCRYFTQNNFSVNIAIVYALIQVGFTFKVDDVPIFLDIKKASKAVYINVLILQIPSIGRPRIRTSAIIKVAEAKLMNNKDEVFNF